MKMITEVENGFEFQETSYGKRIALSVKRDAVILVLLAILPLLLIGKRVGLPFSGMMIALYFIEALSRLKYQLRKVLFNNDGVVLGFYRFSSYQEMRLDYQQLKIRKERLWYKTTSKVFYLSFLHNDQVLVKQFVFFDIDREFMDRLVSKYLAIRSEHI